VIDSARDSEAYEMEARLGREREDRIGERSSRERKRLVIEEEESIGRCLGTKKA